MKKTLRQEILSKRESLSWETVEENSRLIFQTLMELEVYHRAQHIMLFLSFKKEVQTLPYLARMFQDKKRLFIPVTRSNPKGLIVSELIDLEEDLTPSAFGVLEPKPHALRPFPPEKLDLVLVPGVVFDPKGYRIGYGGGYYDRFLPTLPTSTPTIGLAHGIQVVDALTPDPYDFPVQYLLTEKGFIQCHPTVDRPSI